MKCRRSGTWALAAALVAVIAAADAEGRAKDAATAVKPAPTPAQAEKAFQPKDPNAPKCKYLLFLPEGYAQGDAKKRWPLMLFLHGAGERGTNLTLVKKHGPPKLVEKDRSFPFVLVSPQCPRRRWWDVKVLTGLLDDVVKTHAVDKDRIYVTGLSMGGFGTWALAAATPGRFAAIVPICGGGKTGAAKQIKDIPTWVFHGGRDGVVPPARSRQMVDAMKAAGAKSVQLTIYPQAGHDSWSKTYDNPELYKWLLKQTLKARRGAKAQPAR